MEQKKYILGLDVSTSTIGISLFEDLGKEGRLVVLTHFEPTITPNPPTQLEKLIEKAELCLDKIKEDFHFEKYNITKIIVEEPLYNSINQKTAKILEIFNEYFTYKLGKFYNLKIDFITVHNARKFGLSELIGKNGKLMSEFPNSIAGLKKTAWNKFLIMYLISQRYKSITWLLNNNLKINKKNFDRADAIVTALGYMIKEGFWTNMESLDFWKDCDLSHERCIEVIEKNIAYERFSKEHIDKNKEYTPEEKKKVKRKYLDDVFKIKNYINVEY